MKIRRFWWIAVVAGVAAFLGAWLAIPVLAAPSKQSDGAAPDASTAMHEACEAGDVQGMTDAMNSLTEEDWQAMEEHMGDDHYGVMDTHMPGEDWQAMEEHMGDDYHEAMGTHMPGEDWQAMEEHMGDDHQSAMGTGMMGW